jgi:hypothetical protein
MLSLREVDCDENQEWQTFMEVNCGQKKGTMQATVDAADRSVSLCEGWHLMPRTPFPCPQLSQDCKFARKQGLWAFLDAPRRRIQNYPLLLRRILENTPEDHPDHEPLSRALRSICAQVESVDKSVAADEGRQVSLGYLRGTGPRMCKAHLGFSPFFNLLSSHRHGIAPWSVDSCQLLCLLHPRSLSSRTALTLPPHPSESTWWPTTNLSSCEALDVSRYSTCVCPLAWYSLVCAATHPVGPPRDQDGKTIELFLFQHVLLMTKESKKEGRRAIVGQVGREPSLSQAGDFVRGTGLVRPGLKGDICLIRILSPSIHGLAHQNG